MTQTRTPGRSGSGLSKISGPASPVASVSGLEDWILVKLVVFKTGDSDCGLRIMADHCLASTSMSFDCIPDKACLANTRILQAYQIRPSNNRCIMLCRKLTGVWILALLSQRLFKSSTPRLQQSRSPHLSTPSTSSSLRPLYSPAFRSPTLVDLFIDVDIPSSKLLAMQMQFASLSDLSLSSS